MDVQKACDLPFKELVDTKKNFGCEGREQQQSNHLHHINCYEGLRARCVYFVFV